MTAIDGSIAVLSESILDEAQTEIEAIRSRAQAKADSVRQDAREAADRERRDVLDRAQQEARRLHGQATSTAQLKARAMELEHRERLLEKVFDSAAARLSAVPGRKDYREAVLRLAQEAISQLHAEAAELHADAAAQRILAGPQVDVLEKASGVRLQVKPLDSGIGVLAQTPDGRLHFDNRLETRLARLRTSIRSEVYRVLIGESK